MIDIQFGFTDVKAKQDSTPVATDVQPWTSPAQLKSESPPTGHYATLEDDFFRLDGSLELFPDDPKPEQFGWWSKSMSDAAGVFPAPITLDIGFSQNHSSIGLTLVFEEIGNNYPSAFTVKWYASGTLLAERAVRPDSWYCTVSQAVTDYNRITLTFTGTNRPYRYLKVRDLLFGIIKHFNDTTLTDVTCLEEIDPISATISINTLDFELHSSDAEFSIVNPQGVYAYLQKRQPLTVTADSKPFGTFYLDDWEGEEGNLHKMSAIDAIGVMDATTFKGGIYVSVSAATLIEAIMTEVGIAYTLDTSLSVVLLTGYLPICSHRQALQQVAFAIGAVVDCSRTNLVNITPESSAAAIAVGLGRKIEGGKVKLREYVTGVEVTEHSYVKSTESTELFHDTLAAGESEITFSEPCYELTVTGATIKSSGANYAVLTVATTGTVVLSGKRYVDTTRKVGYYAPSLPAGQAVNVKRVEQATLVSASNSAAVAKRVYDYYQRRMEQTFELDLQSEVVGMPVAVTTEYSNTKIACVESLETDLLSMLTKAVVAGA